MRALIGLSVRQMLGGKKIWVVAAFLCLPVLLLALIQLAGGFGIQAVDGVDREDYLMTGFLYIIYPQSLCLLASLLYGASMLAGEIEDKTLTYLFTRSLARWQVLFGKYVTTASVLAVMTCASMSVAYVVAGMPFAPRVWFALALTIVCSCFAYTALFCLLGLFVPRRAIPVGLIYAVVVEGVLSILPAVINQMTVSFYLRCLTWRLAKLPLPEEIAEEFTREVAPLVLGADGPTALVALGTIALLALALSAWVIHRRQWPLTESV